MSAWNKVALSFACVLAGQLLIGVFLSISGGRKLFTEWLFSFMYFGAFFTIPAWLIAIPFVVGLRVRIRSHLLRAFTTGALIGPVTILCADLLFALMTHTSGADGRFLGTYTGIATLVSATISALYLATFSPLSKLDR